LIPRRILPAIVVSQFAGTSLWFAGNAVISDLQTSLNLQAESVGWITNAVQLGFIAGTLIFAFFSFADRFSPVRIFLLCSIIGGIFNLGILISENLFSLLAFRFLTGFFLAGIYPVGMKIAASWYKESLGKALGWLVGALVIGTSFPHLVKGLHFSPDWQWVIILVSIVAISGGLVIYFLVPDGPLTARTASFRFNVLAKAFQSRDFRSAAFGYFGHMWELYTFWAFTPLLIQYYAQQHPLPVSTPVLSFITIGIGGVGCILGGLISIKKGSARVAFAMLLTSGLCCLFSVFIIEFPTPLFFFFLLIWGFSVVGDSPQFSTLSAMTAPPEYVGTGLTIVNSIGFAITIISISLVNSGSGFIDFKYLFLLLLPGPIFGLWSIRKLV
jgi:MFS family permease